MYSFISRLKKLHCNIDKWLYFPAAQTSKTCCSEPVSFHPRAYFLCAPGRDTIGKNFTLAIALETAGASFALDYSFPLSQTPFCFILNM